MTHPPDFHQWAKLPAGEAVDLARPDQDARWRAGVGLPAEEYLAALPAVAADPELAMVLVYGEVLSRAACGESPDAAEYRARFPQWADRIDLQFAVHAALHPSAGATRTFQPDDAATGTFAPLDHAGLLATLTRGLSAPPPPSAAFRFGAGTVLAGRYRIVAPLGKGGMGEVYRADDLTLGQSVALKFLPEHVSSNPASLDRFRKEVAAARQVAHPHVCRVFDIGEAGGQIFLSMEFIPGDDLAGVLRKAGRLSSGLAIDLARQVAAGLHAVHDEGLIHRDLKPANVMVDGKGRARLTDFGLAATAESVVGVDAFSGTPAYQAPEQLSGGAISERTDVYALGLLAYELLTGRRPFDATDRKALIEQQKARPAAPSSVDATIPPEVDRIVLKCLAFDPKDRPTSAHEVWRTLPGDAALNAALAEGRTPTAEAVADAGGEGRLKRRVAVALALGTLLCTTAIAALHTQTHLLAQTPRLSNAGLRAKAAEIAAEFERHPGPYTAGFPHYDSEFRDWQRANDVGMNRQEGVRAGRPLEMLYCYRASDTPLIPSMQERQATAVLPNDPPFGPPGSVLVRVDYVGRLISFHRVPRGERPAAPTIPFTPRRLFALADLDPDAFQPTEPTRDWAVPHDQRYAWAGVYPERPDIPLVVEVATDRGELVAFRLVSPWTSPEKVNADELQRTYWEELWRTLVLTVFPILMIVVGGVLAFWNVRSGRANFRGAVVIALVDAAVFFVHLAAWAVVQPTSQSLYSWMAETVMKTGTEGGMLAIAYLAFEPFVRRRWPLHLVGWSRLLDGRWRDPMVGRDLLTGALVGSLAALIVLGTIPVPKWLGLPPEQTLQYFDYETPIGGLAGALLRALLMGITLTFVMFLVSRIVRTPWLWLPVLVGLLMLASHDPRLHQWAYTVPILGCCIAAAWCFYRQGLLAVVAAGTFTWWHLLGFLTFDLNTTYWPITVSFFAAILLTVGFGLVVSVGGWRRLVNADTAG